jgi:hypothetical protein
VREIKTKIALSRLLPCTAPETFRLWQGGGMASIRMCRLFRCDLYQHVSGIPYGLSLPSFAGKTLSSLLTLLAI